MSNEEIYFETIELLREDGYTAQGRLWEDGFIILADTQNPRIELTIPRWFPPELVQSNMTSVAYPAAMAISLTSRSLPVVHTASSIGILLVETICRMEEPKTRDNYPCGSTEWMNRLLHVFERLRRERSLEKE
jgi:hypothetical protein